MQALDGVGLGDDCFARRTRGVAAPGCLIDHEFAQMARRAGRAAPTASAADVPAVTARRAASRGSAWRRVAPRRAPTRRAAVRAARATRPGRLEGQRAQVVDDRLRCQRRDAVDLRRDHRAGYRAARLEPRSRCRQRAARLVARDEPDRQREPGREHRPGASGDFVAPRRPTVAPGAGPSQQRSAGVRQALRRAPAADLGEHHPARTPGQVQAPRRASPGGHVPAAVEPAAGADRRRSNSKDPRTEGPKGPRAQGREPARRRRLATAQRQSPALGRRRTGHPRRPTRHSLCGASRCGVAEGHTSRTKVGGARPRLRASPGSRVGPAIDAITPCGSSPASNVGQPAGQRAARRPAAAPAAPVPAKPESGSPTPAC